MTTLLSPLREFLRKGDGVLLALCLAASAYGLVLVYSATRYLETNRNMIVQSAAVLIGVVAYVVMTFVDFRMLTERCWKLLLCFNVCFILLVVTPIGVDLYGNRNWISIPGIPFNIQPNEIVKIPFILLLAYQIVRLRERGYDLSSIPSVLQIAGHTLFMVGLIAAVCGDMGTCTIYLVIFAVMAWVSGVKLRWFALAVGGITAVAVIAWALDLIPNYILMRFLVVLDRDLDPLNFGYQQSRSIQAIASGQLFGQGFLQGTQSQSDASLPFRENDFIFAVCGEEFGFVGCALLLLILAAIVLRCIWIGRQADSPFSSYVAFGIAGMLMAQIIFNVGMCLYVLPVMGLTLPFISYGGSSVITLYAAMGVVSSTKANTPPSWLKDR